MNHKPSFLVILSLIFIAGFSLRPGITSIAPALSEIQTHFHVPESLLGLLTAIPVMCMGVLSPLAHWAAQRAGIKMTLLIGFMLVAVGETLRVQTYWFSVLVFTSLLVGIGDALIRPVLSGFIKQHSGRYTPLAIGWYAASMGIGSGCAAILTTPVGSALGGFEFGLAIWALPTLLSLIAFSTGMPSREQDSHSVVNVVLVVKRSLIIALTLLFGLQSGLNYAIAAWLPQWLIAQGESATAANQYTFVFIIIGTLTCLSYPLFVASLRHSESRTVLLATALLTLAPICYVANGPVWLLIGLLSMSIGIFFPLVLQLPLAVTHTPTDAIRLSGIVQSLGYLLGGLAPAAVGVMAKQYGVIDALDGIVLIITLSMTVTAGCLAYWLKR